MAVINRGPYLQLRTATSVRMVLRLDVSGALTLNIAGQVLAHGALVEHVWDVTGLIPGAEYAYLITGDATTTGTVHAYPANHAKLAFLGDTGAGSVSQQQVRDRMIEFDPHAIMFITDTVYPNWTNNGGDPIARANVVHFGSAQYQTLLKRTPFYSVCGGHDYEAGAAGSHDGQDFLDAYHLPGDELTYVTSCGPADIFSVSFLGDSIPINIAALEPLLIASKARWKVVCVGDILYTGGITHPEQVTQRNLVEPLLYKYGVDVVFQGSEHHYERLSKFWRGAPNTNGPIYVTTGWGGNEGLYNFAVPKRAGSIVQHNATNGVVLVTATETDFSAKAVDKTGLIIDTWALSKKRGGSVKGRR